MPVHDEQRGRVARSSPHSTRLLIDKTDRLWKAPASAGAFSLGVASEAGGSRTNRSAAAHEARSVWLIRADGRRRFRVIAAAAAAAPGWLVSDGAPDRIRTCDLCLRRAFVRGLLGITTADRSF